MDKDKKVNFKQLIVNNFVEKWNEHSNLSHIRTFMRNGLNINLPNSGRIEEHNQAFRMQLIKSSIIYILAAISVTFSWTTWENPHVNQVFGGNFYVGLGIPKSNRSDRHHLYHCNQLNHFHYFAPIIQRQTNTSST